MLQSSTRLDTAHAQLPRPEPSAPPRPRSAHLDPATLRSTAWLSALAGGDGQSARSQQQQRSREQEPAGLQQPASERQGRSPLSRKLRIRLSGGFLRPPCRLRNVLPLSFQISALRRASRRALHSTSACLSLPRNLGVRREAGPPLPALALALSLSLSVPRPLDTSALLSSTSPARALLATHPHRALARPHAPSPRPPPPPQPSPRAACSSPSRTHGATASPAALSRCAAPLLSLLQRRRASADADPLLLCSSSA